jgi:hypothetical protein
MKTGSVLQFPDSHQIEEAAGTRDGVSLGHDRHS